MSNDNETKQTEVIDLSKPVVNGDVNDINSDLPPQDELAILKARADMLGVEYHPSIGVAKLREKIEAKLAEDDKTNEVETVEAEAPVEAEETLIERRNRKKREANELVRINISCMNPAKKEWEGEYFTAGNSLVGSFTKFVPYNTEDGWYVPRIILNIIKEKQCQIFRSNPIKGGPPIPALIKEFSVAILPNLTAEELYDLAQRQAMAKSID